MDDIKYANGDPFIPEAYPVIVFPLSEDEGGGWMAKIPDLPGCVGDGETEAEAMADVRSAARCWAHGEKDIPRPGTQKLIAAE